MSDSVRLHGQQPTRLLHPWDSPGKNAGVGCHCLLQSEVPYSACSASTPGIYPRTHQVAAAIGGMSQTTGRTSRDGCSFLDVRTHAQSCLCDPMDYSPPGSSVHGESQARILQWVAISFSRGSSPPREPTVSPASLALAGRLFTAAPPGMPTSWTGRLNHLGPSARVYSQAGPRSEFRA